VRAEVTWEDVDRASQEVWFSASGPAADALSAEPQAFLLAAAVPALRARERRIAVEGSVTPRLRDGLTQIFQALTVWFDPTRPIPAIEPSGGFRVPALVPGRRVASFLSCGLDSLALLRANRIDFPSQHPASIQDVIFVNGFDIGAPGTGDQPDLARRARAGAANVASDAGAELLALETNLRHLEPDQTGWPNEWCGTAAAAVAHALVDRVAVAHVAGSYSMATLFPHGSPPLVDPLASSDALEIRIDGLHQLRLAKARLIADWDAALQNLRVCWAGVSDEGPLNCGRCHKCRMTALELWIAGALGRCTTLPGDDIEPGQLEAIRETTTSSLPFLEELLEPLAAAGRADLFEVIERKVTRIREVRDRGAQGSRWPVARWIRQWVGLQ
jgi:hypothetical protein